MAATGAAFVTLGFLTSLTVPVTVSGFRDLVPAEEGHPLCFKDHHKHGYTYDRCCNRDLGPHGLVTCWDAYMDFGFCCRPMAPLPKRAHPTCWTGLLENRHEMCCMGGSQHLAGPRGQSECWEEKERAGEPSKSTLGMCCDFFSAWRLANGSSTSSMIDVWARFPGSSSRAACLIEGYATTCSFPGIAFRVPDWHDNQLAMGKGASLPKRARPPLLWQLPAVSLRATRPRLELLTLGVGTYKSSVAQLVADAGALDVFDAVHAFSDFSFLSEDERQRWERHLRAWREGARIAGYGWWKPFLCRKLLSSASLASGRGLLVFSDAGSRLEPESAASWQSLAFAMRSYDVMAVVDIEHMERHWTKRRTLRQFEHGLRGTGFKDEGQFVSRLFVLRNTPATQRLLAAWEQLVEDITLVNEDLDPRGEAPEFRAHRHEQSVWSLLLKSAILGRPVQRRPGAPQMNVTARILTITEGYEAHQLTDFARRHD
ncbi:unnamed protein product [Polarella glacialis]|uniref:Uncharacterized protein n=1 Tax=Polarella glacialis TaxID=89957 RepID=A0A813L8K1_POLGL|nr:unnamed protein product [Polarella glacialis]CAE8725038.1 unnamed protein product [Polarella glacialis]